MDKKTIGFVVNPIAGVGGALGWKGTDDYLKAWKTTNLAGSERAITRAHKALQSIPDEIKDKIKWITASGIMGGQIFENIGLEFLEIYFPEIPTTPEDTRKFIRKAIEKKVDLLVFVGGDGTATIVAQELKNTNIPGIGVPAGVKITSPCFIKRPELLGSVLKDWLEGKLLQQHVEVIDLLEKDYVNGRVNPVLTGEILTLISPYLQGEKTIYRGTDPELIELSYEGIAETLKEDIKEGYWIIGPGSTTFRVMEKLGYKDLTLLGVDVLFNGEVIAKDVNCEQLIDILQDASKGEIFLLMTPIGGQGFVLGRGNQQICCPVLKKVPLDHLIIVSTPEKIADLKELYIDVDCDYPPHGTKTYAKVIIGNYQKRMIKLKVL